MATSKAEIYTEVTDLLERMGYQFRLSSKQARSPKEKGV